MDHAPLPDVQVAPATGRARRGGPRLSAILTALADGAEGDRISLGDMVDAFDARAYGPLIVLFAAPNMLPVALPGISAILGAPLILLTGQLMIGRRRPWLPQILRRRSLARTSFQSLIGRIVPRLHRIERMIRPRYLMLTGVQGKRVIGAMGLVLAAIMFLPIPFGNALPGLALVLMAAGILGRDGLAVLAGGIVGLAGLVLVSGFVWGAVQAALLFARSGLGM